MSYKLTSLGARGRNQNARDAGCATRARRNQMVTTMTNDIQTLLGDQAESLLGFDSPKIPKERLHLPGPDFVDRVFMQSDRNNRVLGNLEWMFKNGRLGGKIGRAHV